MKSFRIVTHGLDLTSIFFIFYFQHDFNNAHQTLYVCSHHDTNELDKPRTILQTILRGPWIITFELIMFNDLMFAQKFKY